MPPRLSNWSFPASLVPPWCLAGCLTSPFLPPWCLAGCPISPFLPPWCLPGAFQAVQLILSCLPGASQAVQLVLSCLPGAPWCLAGCLTNPFLPPWCSLVPARLSKWSFPAGDPPGFASLASGLPSATQISMATSLFCAKSWGGPYGRLPVPQNGL